LFDRRHTSNHSFNAFARNFSNMSNIPKIPKMPNQPPYAILPDRIPIPPITSTNKPSELNYYGPLEPNLAPQASKFLAAVTNANEHDLTSTISSFLLAAQADCVGDADSKKACWFTIRVTHPSDAVKVPRWHQDGRMYPYDTGREDIVRSKYALTLLGPRTLMLHPTAHVFATLNKGESQFCPWRTSENAPVPTEDDEYAADDALRDWLAAAFADAERVSVGEGQVVRFSWGRDDSPVHSEPHLSGDRVFVTVLFGSESELRVMCELRGAEYGVVSLEG
jgi:hypothetical protein